MAYSLANSLSPMMFRKSKDKKKERNRSRSLENIMDVDPEGRHGRHTRAVSLAPGQPAMNVERPLWNELSLVKGTSPVVTCVLPPIARDFVCSALLSMGATPLIVEGESASLSGPPAHCFS